MKCCSFWLFLRREVQVLSAFQGKTIVCLLINDISNMYIEEASFGNHVDIKTAYIHGAHILHYIEIVYLKCQEVYNFFQYQYAV